MPQLPDGVFVEDNSPDSECNRRFIAAAKERGIANTKMRTSLGRGQFASSFNLLLPDALATGNLTIVPNAVVREITVDKNTGLANGVNFLDRQSHREMHAKARVVVVGASCLESTRLLLNSGIANSSGALGHYLHDQFYITQSVQAVVPEARDGKAASGFIGGGGYMPRFRNLQTKEEEFPSRLCAGLQHRRHSRCQVLPAVWRGTTESRREFPRRWLQLHGHGRSPAARR